MAQNIYDDDDFLSGYSQLPRSVGGLDSAPEWPIMRQMLPTTAGKRVLDLGCGFGFFCRWAADQGAALVVGIDVSANMLARAVGLTTAPTVEYRRHDLESLGTFDRPCDAPFDLVYSSLTLHYIADLTSLLQEVHDLLVPGGAFVVSIEHPIFSAPTKQELAGDEGALYWPLDNYLVEGPRSRRWFVDGVVKHHRTVGNYLNEIIDAGFDLTRVHDWGPSEADIAEHPEWVGEQHRPYFLLVGARRR